MKRRQAEAPGSRIERAVERFNASEAGRTVAGLTRSLGRPRVSVGAAAGSPSMVRVTVAWDLCWYQWGVDGGEAGQAVAELAKGNEIEQLDRSARHWNASVDEGAQIVVGRPGRMPRPRRRAGWLGRR